LFQSQVVAHFQLIKYHFKLLYQKYDYGLKNFIKRLIFFFTKKMRVKLQTPSTNELPALNPILPLSAVTQVMLVANPTQV
jgi:hypothetical protein